MISARTTTRLLTALTAGALAFGAAACDGVAIDDDQPGINDAPHDDLDNDGTTPAPPPPMDE